MKIVRCSNCGKYIHKAEMCYHCGNTEGFEVVSEPTVHEKVAQDYLRMADLIESKRYEQAIELSYAIIEWMPNLAGVFWLRLLAKNKCSTALELITKGFPCDDADFWNALRFSTGEEHATYEDIQKCISEIRPALMREISANEYKCKKNTNIIDVHKSISKEVDKRKESLFSLWSELEKTEQSLYQIELDCRLLTKEHQTGLIQAAQTASAIKAETYRMDECAADKLHSYQVRLEDARKQSKTAMDALESMKKEHPWVKTFNEIVSKRNQQVKQIASAISSLSEYEKTVQQAIAEVERIESRHKFALSAADKYDFSDAATLLGEDSFSSILRAAGVYAEPQTAPTSTEQKSSVVITTEPDTIADDSWEADDYYSAWELNNG